MRVWGHDRSCIQHDTATPMGQKPLALPLLHVMLRQCSAFCGHILEGKSLSTRLPVMGTLDTVTQMCKLSQTYVHILWVKEPCDKKLYEQFNHFPWPLGAHLVSF